MFKGDIWADKADMPRGVKEMKNTIESNSLLMKHHS
jgi:hypothetical protein